ncbi:hypothetical protein KGF57_001329 [Candida theae]|uniref:Uncharacterized protein n=1 Tax=Candida theae TaxID=1198502 RepID=A0AAD5FZZ3_9ASCO|nr:uncharacterized protein KGF57_001329 [Candida theae]KAI5962890.1 hypothetical protein KGF57_001329 [Candida theae]
MKILSVLGSPNTEMSESTSDKETSSDISFEPEISKEAVKSIELASSLGVAGNDENVSSFKEEMSPAEMVLEDTEFYSLDPNQAVFDTSMFRGSIENGREINPFSLDLSLNIFAQEHLEFEFEFESSRVEGKGTQKVDESARVPLCIAERELKAGDIPDVSFDTLELDVDSMYSRIRYLLVEKECYELLIERQKRWNSELKKKVMKYDDRIFAPIVNESFSDE